MTKPNGWTGGEWEVRDVDGEYRVYGPDHFTQGFRSEVLIVDCVGGLNVKAADGAWDESQHKANAQLIASAPKMYAALAALIEVAEAADVYAYQLAEARLAVSLARGES